MTKKSLTLLTYTIDLLIKKFNFIVSGKKPSKFQIPTWRESPKLEAQDISADLERSVGCDHAGGDYY